MNTRRTHRLVALLATFAFGLSFLATAAPVALAAQPDSSADSAFIDGLNKERAKAGLDPLYVDASMSAAARSWSQVMAGSQNLQHASDITVGAPSDWRKVGENVGRGYSVDSLVDAFMASAPHAANVLDPKFTYVGVGTVVDGNGQLWTTHRFAATASGPPDEPSEVAGEVLDKCFGEDPTILALPGMKTVGTPDRDVIVGSSGDDVIYGLGGDDLICGRGGDDKIVGGSGNDRMLGNKGNDRLLGKAGHDVILGGSGKDVLKGGKGADKLKGGKGADKLKGGKGSDNLKGGKGADELKGGAGKDLLRGGGGIDYVVGGPGKDTIKF